MELYKEILIKLLEKKTLNVSLSDVRINANELIEAESYQTLCEIKNIIEDDSLNDRECFSKIEEVICAFESIGSGGFTRHDF